MILDLINPSLYNYSFPWGNYCNRTAINLERNVHWFPGMIVFDCIKEFERGWICDETTDYQVREITADYTCGLIITKDQHWYGTYTLHCTLPQFRGSWPAFWGYDIIPPKKGGIQCEFDVFEHFFKRCLDKHKVTCTYHDGDKPDIIKSHWQFSPVKEMEFKFIWHPNSLTWFVNGKMVMEVLKSQVNQFPNKPMNLILNSGFGLWNIQNNKLEPFVVTQFYKEYYP